LNELDLVVLVLGIGAAIGGWRLGFAARVLAWAGVVVGLAIGVHFVPRIVTVFGGARPENRASIAVLFLLLVATLGQTLGLALSAVVHRLSPARKPLPRWDRAAGAIVGALGVLALLWMVIPSLATARGWPARLARSSAIVAAIQEWAPKQPARFAAWGRAISEAPYPSALGTLQSPPNPGVPPAATSLTPRVDARVRAATLKVVGRACDTIQEGTGWIAGPGLVVTNAHVVAGERATTVQDESGREMSAVVIAFDPVRDVALLRVPALRAPRLPIVDGAVGDVGAVYGHPGGGALQAAPARVGNEILAVGTDIYRTSTSRRHVYVLASRLAPGDSGGALVDTKGDVIGMAFAIDPGRNATAYALTDREIRAVLDTARRRTTPVDTGRCLVS
jgi:Trypsin-like peptidase domain/Colicin V production protein